MTFNNHCGIGIVLISASISDVALGCFQQGSLGEVMYDYCRVDTRSHSIKVHWRDENGIPYRYLDNFLQAQYAKGKLPLFVANGGIFEISDHVARPLGLHIESGTQLRPINLDTNRDGNFFMPFGDGNFNGVFVVSNQNRVSIVNSNEYTDWAVDKGVVSAIQSGPLMVRRGTINANFRAGSNNRLPRCGVGVINDSEAVYIRTTIVNFYDFSSIFREQFHAMDALYLDGVICESVPSSTDRQEPEGFAAIIAVYNKAGEESVGESTGR